MIGTRLGIFEITAKLGEGGMGVVYRAKDLQLGRDVALKVLRVPSTEDPDHVSRLEAYELYLRGRNSLHQFTEEGYRHSLIDFDAAIARDPNFALAWASIAEAHAEMCIDGSLSGSQEETIRLAKTAAARALELDNELDEVHGISGLIQFVFDFDWRGAERSFLKSHRTQPGQCPSARALRLALHIAGTVRRCTTRGSSRT
jgi:serine/threonine protein kinase